MMHSVIWQGLMFIPAVKHNDCCQEGGQAIFPGAVDWFLFSPTFHHPGTYSPPWNWGRLLKMPWVAQRWQRFIPDVLPVSWPWLEGDSLDKLDSVAPVLFFGSRCPVISVQSFRRESSLAPSWWKESIASIRNGTIHINTYYTIFGVMNIHQSQLSWCSPG